jgi:malonate-semialdehyde dehydrogenase (acetylating)/methylmalonate-semialdehyde dehydrogenase
MTAVPILIGENWLHPEVEQTGPVYNPATGEVIGRVPLCGAAEVDQAVAHAGSAFASWGNTPPPKRARVLFRYRELLEAHFEELSRLIATENGKTLDEARGDLRRGVEVVEFACGISHLAKGENLPRLAEEVDGMTMREPLGVCAGITPFNFPAMVPMWMYPLAIACGNAFVLKPSEKVPLTANRLAELFLEAGLPPGVFNVVHGGREVVDALCTHPGIRAISFVGSSPVARHVYTTACQQGKRVQAAGGAKNVLVVLPDADPEPTIRAVMGSAFGCAGQRCMAGSLLMGVGKAADPLREQLLAAMDKLPLGDPVADPRTGMGPVIDGKARDRHFAAIAEAPGVGLEIARDGRQGLPAKGFFVGPTLLDHVGEGHRVFSEELFGPVLSMLRPASLEEALACFNQLPFGNAATLFTESGTAARQFALQAKCGMIGINLGVPAPMALFAFSGWDQSFYGDLHVQGTEGVMFYTRQKTVLSRWAGGFRHFF